MTSLHKKWKIKQNIFLQEIGLVIQPLLFCFAAIPDGLDFDKECCDYTCSPADLLYDQSFYLQ